MTKSQVITRLVNRALSGDLNLKQLIELTGVHALSMRETYYIACCISVNAGCSKAGQLADFNHVYPVMPTVGE